MYHNLYNAYKKNGLVNFTLSLMETLTLRVSTADLLRNPLAGVSAVESVMTKWEQKGHWERFSKDQFWTAVLFLVMSNSPNREKLISKVVEHIGSTEGDDDDREGSTPIFKYAKSLLQQEKLNNKLSLQSIKTSGTMGAGKQSDDRSVTFTTSDRYKSARFPTTTERAALALSEAHDPVHKIYKDEVFKDKGISVQLKSSGKTPYAVPYVAVKTPSKVCAICYPNGKDQAVEGCGARAPGKHCFKEQCSRCKFFGHTKNSCLQTLSSDGEDLEVSL
jgi:hypothetical protein